MNLNAMVGLALAASVGCGGEAFEAGAPLAAPLEGGSPGAGDTAPPGPPDALAGQLEGAAGLVDAGPAEAAPADGAGPVCAPLLGVCCAAPLLPGCELTASASPGYHYSTPACCTPADFAAVGGNAALCVAPVPEEKCQP